MLQKRVSIMLVICILQRLTRHAQIMFFGHPVERLCTYQYSLVTLVPGTLIIYGSPLNTDTFLSGLLQNLDDCGSPPLAARAATLQRPNSLKTSDPKSMMAYMGLPLDLFGKVAHMFHHIYLQLRLTCSVIGRLLPTVSAAATTRYAQRNRVLAMWEYELDRHSAERNRLARQCMRSLLSPASSVRS